MMQNNSDNNNDNNNNNKRSSLVVIPLSSDESTANLSNESVANLPTHDDNNTITEQNSGFPPGLIPFLYFIAFNLYGGHFGTQTLRLWSAFGFFALINVLLAYRSTYRPEYARWRWIDIGIMMTTFVLGCVSFRVPMSDALCLGTMFTVPFVASLISLAAKDPFVKGATKHMNLEEKLTPTIYMEFTLWMSVYLTGVFAIMASITWCTFLVPEYPLWFFPGLALGFLIIGFAGCFPLYQYYEQKAQNQTANENEKDCTDDGTDSMV